MMLEVSIHFLQQQVRKFWVESWEVRFFLWGGHVPLHASDLDRCPLWGLSVPVLFLIVSLLFLRLRICSASCGLVSLLMLVRYSARGVGGVFGFVPLYPPYPLILCLRRSSLPTWFAHSA